MERIEALFHDTDGKCYVSFSGGKDSTVILALIKMCEDIYTLPPNAMPAVFCNTGIELGATVEFAQWVKENYYSNVQVIRPDPKKPFEKYNKENDIEGFITGLRSDEGGARQLQADGHIKNGGSLCTTMRGGLINKLPIIDWTDSDIEDFINEHNVPLSKAYTEQGYERTGCFLCPYSLQLRDNLVKLHKYEPLRYKAAMHWLKDVYIAQGVILPFDAEYEAERLKKWNNSYSMMRYEMLCKYRPLSAKKYENEQQSLF